MLAIIFSIKIFFHSTLKAQTINHAIKCDQGLVLECLKDGKKLYKAGKTEEALKLFKLACDMGELNGCSAQAAIEYKQGNHDEANKLLTKACLGKNQNACEALKKISPKP